MVARGKEWLFCLLIAGCAGSSTVGPGPAQPGDSQGPPRVEALPSLDVGDDELTREMRMARMLSEESLNLAAPPGPEGRAAEEIQVWSEQTLATWLEQKQRRAEAAREELDRAALQSHRQRIVAGALVGLVYEDVARVLLSLPAPLELESEPAVLATYRELLEQQAAPYLMHAKLGYDACAANAQAIESLEHWTSFCGERSRGLPASGAGEEASRPGTSNSERGAGETEVTVSRE